MRVKEAIRKAGKSGKMSIEEAGWLRRATGVVRTCRAAASRANRVIQEIQWMVWTYGFLRTRSQVQSQQRRVLACETRTSQIGLFCALDVTQLPTRFR